MVAEAQPQYDDPEKTIWSVWIKAEAIKLTAATIDSFV